MNSLLANAKIVDDFGLIERKEREENDRIFRSIITEEKGSYCGQFEEAERIAKGLLRDGYQNSTYSDGKYTYELILDKFSEVPSNGITIGNRVKITVNPIIIHLCDMTSTIAHEIMHLFQQRLPKVDGVNEWSMFLYRYLMSFANGARSRFSYLFFYGLYFNFSIERKANVSTISNYLNDYFNGEKANTEEIQDALSKCDKYRPYVEFTEFFKSAKPTKEDIQYIGYCLTRELKNPYSGEMETIYNPKDFDCSAFIDENTKNILKYSQETINKMHKNAMIYLEKEEQHD